MNVLVLRDYQENLINKVKDSWKNGYKHPCIVAPCGAGKTVILAEMAKKATEKKKRVMFIVHRKELCEQTSKTFEKYGVDMNYCSVNMIQTLANNLDEVEKPDFIMVDENHHSKANSYKKIFEKFTDIYRIGVTATPTRLDGSGFKDVNDILIEEVTAKWLIENNYLAPAKLFSAPLIDLKGVKTKKGEYDTGECEQLLDNNIVYGDVIKHWRDKAENKQTIVYCVSVKHSENTAKIFLDEGITAAHIDGTTPKKQRDEVISDFRAGEIRVLCNCDIVSEGFDVPDCECVILLRPTQSLTIFIQQSMRCMRPKEGKQAIILDHVANVFRFGLPWKDREWTLEGKKNKNKKKAKEEEENTFWTCEGCFFSWDKSEGRFCPDCGLEIPISERELKIIEQTKLIEITEKMFEKSRKEKREELKRIQADKGYKKGWIWHQMQAFDKKHEEKINELKKEIASSKYEYSCIRTEQLSNKLNKNASESYDNPVINRFKFSRFGHDLITLNYMQYTILIDNGDKQNHEITISYTDSPFQEFLNRKYVKTKDLLLEIQQLIMDTSMAGFHI